MSASYSSLPVHLSASSRTWSQVDFDELRDRAHEAAKRGEWREAAELLERSKKGKDRVRRLSNDRSEEDDAAAMSALEQKLDNKRRVAEETWEAKHKQLLERCKREDEEQRARHASELAQLEAEVTERWTQRKDSTQILELSQKLRALAAREKYTEAAAVQSDVKHMRRLDKLRNRDLLVEQLQLRRNHMLFRHANEAAMLHSEHEHKFKEWKQRKIQDLAQQSSQARFFKRHLAEQQLYRCARARTCAQDCAMHGVLNTRRAVLRRPSPLAHTPPRPAGGSANSASCPATSACTRSRRPCSPSPTFRPSRSTRARSQGDISRTSRRFSSSASPRLHSCASACPSAIRTSMSRLSSCRRCGCPPHHRFGGEAGTACGVRDRLMAV